MADKFAGPYASEAVFQTGLLEQILKKRQDVAMSRINLFWSAVSFFIAFGLLFEMYFGYYLLSLSNDFIAVWPSATAVLVICSTSFLVHFFRYVKFGLFSSPVELTVSQQKLFGVLESEPGFRIIQPVPFDNSQAKAMAGPNYSPSVYTGRSAFKCSPSRSANWMDQSLSRCSHGGSGLFSSPSMLGSHQGSLHGTPPTFSSAISPYWTTSPGYILGAVSGRSSPSACPRMDANGGLLSASFNSPSMPASQSSSPGAVSSNSLATALQQDMFAEMTGLKTKSRRTSRSPTVSPLRTSDCIQDLGSLDNYLREQQEKDSKPSAVDLTPGSPPGQSSFWTYGRSANDLFPALRQYQYQLATRSTQSAASIDDPSSQTDSPSCEHVWTKLGVTSDQVDHWVENLRKWISKTILLRLVSEIDEVNILLVRHGSDDVQIGEASLSTLKQLAVVKSQHIPQLAALIPYIDIVPNQEYLIQRIRELASGGCMSAFKWNGGAEFKGKRWDDSLPTDSAILIHLLCSYLDARLPGHPKYPDGKTFTSQHFIKTPDKPNLTDRKDNLCIYQTQINPPHFKVVIEDTVWNIKEGRHNLFHAILVFLYHIKTREHGMLRRINLGMSGINIAWVFEQ